MLYLCSKEVINLDKGRIFVDKSYVLQIAICEDVQADAVLLESHIKKSGIPAECRCFGSGEELLASFCAGLYDLIFMDIYMNDMRGISAARGIETVKKIRETDVNVVIAFVTSSQDHTREGYQLKALRYLDKPVSAIDVKETLELALAQRKSRLHITLTLASGVRTELPLDSIMFFEQQNRVVRVHMPSGTLTTCQSARMDKMEAQLPSPPFLRCHNSYLVNLDYVYKVDRELVAFCMKNGDTVDIRKRDFGKCRQYEVALDKWRMSRMGRDEA